MKRFLTVLLLLGAAAAGGWYFLRARPAQAVAVAPVGKDIVSKAELRDIDFNIQLTGDIIPDIQVELKPEVSGKVKRLYVDTGGTVKRGELIAEIDDADLQTERASALTDIEGARLKVDKNRRNFNRAKELIEARLITQEVFDNLAADLAISENDLTKAERRLQTVEERISKTKVFAPADGTILSINVIEGQVVVGAGSVNSGTTLMMLADLKRLKIDSHVNQVDISNIKLGQTIQFECRAIGEVRSSADVSFIAPIASNKNNVKGFKIEAMIPDPDSRLRPGLTVQMKVPIASADHCVSVPVSAVFKDTETNTTVVYVRRGDSTEKRRVEVGVTDLFFAQIRTGLKEGEEILLVEPKS